VQSRGSDGTGAMLAPFASLARQGIACAGLALGQARSMPLALRRSDASGATAAAAAGSIEAVAAPPASGASAGGDASAATRSGLVPSFGLAAYSGGGRVELIDERSQTVLVRMRPPRRTEKVAYFEAKTVVDPQPGCEIFAPGDRFVGQLIDPYDLPPLRAPPQRIAYERVIAGDPAALALLNDRIVLVGALLPGRDRMPMPWPADDRWGVELFAAQIDAMTRHVAIRPIHPVAEWALMTGLALLGAWCGHRLRERPRWLRLTTLGAISLVWVAASIAWYRYERQLIGVPYDVAALLLGAWLANRDWRRTAA